MIKPTSNIATIIRESPDNTIDVTVIPPTPTHIHPETGIPQLNFDQFIHIADIHQNVLEDTKNIMIHEEVDDIECIVIKKLSKNALTRATLMKQPDWPDWEKSKFLQLEQYRGIMMSFWRRPKCSILSW